MTRSTKAIAFPLFAVCLLALSCSLGDERESQAMNEDTSGQPTETAVTTVNPNPTTFYVRPDGAAPGQCDGTADAPYPGDGVDQTCAWDHPFRALPPEGPARIRGGDTLVIAQGSYMMGYGAPGAEMCEADYPWDCHMVAVPSGTPDRPTRILGGDWDTGCARPPELWGTERADVILNLDGASYLEVACLEITDHAGCAEDHSGGLACQRDRFPYGEWAATGLYAADSAGVYLHHLDIHGLASGGVLAGRLVDWTVEDTRVSANGWVGWDGDIDGEDANAGTLTFRRWLVTWNGCVETYPEGEPAGCWAQSAGGYGDGVGTGETGGAWIIEDSAFLHNTSDGLDLLYTRLAGSNVIVRRSISAGNAGDQIKTTGPTRIENVIAVSNCGFFSGKPFTFNVDACRAGGSAIALSPRPGDQIAIVNSTITGQGDCLVIAECADGGCDGSERVALSNTILLGHPEFDGAGDRTCLAWSGLDHDPFSYDHDIMSDLKAMPAPCPAGSLCGAAPGLSNEDIDGFEATLLANSPAIDAGTADAAPPDDFTGKSRDARPDIGAYEW